MGGQADWSGIEVGEDESCRLLIIPDTFSKDEPTE